MRNGGEKYAIIAGKSRKVEYMANQSKVGERIGKYRRNLDMSVADLAAKSGVDESVVSAIEAGEVLPALGVLTKISRALGQRLGTFMDDLFKPDPIITRKADLEAALAAGGESGKEVAGRSYLYQSLALGKPDRHMDPFYIELPAEADDKFSSHEGEELIICAEGEVEIGYGEEKFLLKPGDTAYYNSVVKHSVRAAGGKAARIYGIVFMPA